VPNVRDLVSHRRRSPLAAPIFPSGPTGHHHPRWGIVVTPHLGGEQQRRVFHPLESREVNGAREMADRSDRRWTRLAWPLAWVALSVVLVMALFRGVWYEPGELDIEDAARYACYEAIDRMSPTPYAADFEIEEAPQTLRRATDGTIEMQFRFTAKSAHGSSTSVIAYCNVSSNGQRVERIRQRRTP
ncbi:hypothetical protein P3W85_33845, partial [Cupriavidus basilensis]